MDPFVPDAFTPPAGLAHRAFRLRPLGPEHNDSDFEAWSSSIEHIRRTPGFEGRSWPRPMTREENRADLVRHAADFAARRGFTYTVLAPDDATVIGCVYVYPSDRPGFDAQCSSWVRAADAHVDPILWAAVAGWLAESWPFARVDYAVRIVGDASLPVP